MENHLKQLALTFGNYLKQREWKLVTAESCTGGGVAYLVTEIPGSSNWLERGFVTYSNQAKHDLLGVKLSTLQIFGAVSQQTAREMAEGALQRSEAQVSIAITGIAGPSGGTVEKPVGTVWFSWAGIAFETETTHRIFSGDRHTIRQKSIEFALSHFLSNCAD